MNTLAAAEMKMTRKALDLTANTQTNHGERLYCLQAFPLPFTPQLLQHACYGPLRSPVLSVLRPLIEKQNLLQDFKITGVERFFTKLTMDNN